MATINIGVFTATAITDDFKKAARASVESRGQTILWQSVSISTSERSMALSGANIRRCLRAGQLTSSPLRGQTRGSTAEPGITLAEARRPAEVGDIETTLAELEDIRALNAALAKPKRRMIPFEVTSAVLDGAGPVRAWRECRGLSLQSLAASVGVDASWLAELERGARKATQAELRKLAHALGTKVDDLRDPPAS